MSHATSIVFSMCVVAAVLLLPLGLAQSSPADFTARNVIVAAVLGVVCTALTFSLIMDGMHFIKVQHAAIMGYVEPRQRAALRATSSSARCRRGGRSPAGR